MNPSRLALLAAAGGLALNPLRADSSAPWTPDRQFSAEQVITTKDGSTINTRVYVDTGKIRTESEAHGKDVVAIVLLDEKKMYTVMDEGQMVLEVPVADARAQRMQAVTGGGDAKFEIVGMDPVDGVKYTKEKMTMPNDPNIYFWWVDRAANVPVKMASADGSFSILFRDYQTGPQDASLFLPPAGYRLVHRLPGPYPPGPGAPHA